MNDPARMRGDDAVDPVDRVARLHIVPDPIIPPKQIPPVPPPDGDDPLPDIDDPPPLPDPPPLRDPPAPPPPVSSCRSNAFAPVEIRHGP